jgi:hypothetical protein
VSFTPDSSSKVRPVTADELFAALIPDTPAGAVEMTPVDDTPAPQAADTAGIASVAYRPDGSGALVPVYVPPPLAPVAVPDHGPLVPRWAVGTAVASVGVGAGAVLIGYALDLISEAVAALVAGAAAAMPFLIIGLVILVALLGGRRRPGLSVVVKQTVRIGK